MLRGGGESMPLAAEHDGKGRLDGGSGTHIAAGGVRVDSQVDGRRRKVRSGREAVHGRVEPVSYTHLTLPTILLV